MPVPLFPSPPRDDNASGPFCLSCCCLSVCLFFLLFCLFSLFSSPFQLLFEQSSRAVAEVGQVLVLFAANLLHYFASSPSVCVCFPYFPLPTVRADVQWQNRPKSSCYLQQASALLPSLFLSASFPSFPLPLPLFLSKRVFKGRSGPSPYVICSKPL